jgi:hypothetical protein
MIRDAIFFRFAMSAFRGAAKHFTQITTGRVSRKFAMSIFSDMVNRPAHATHTYFAREYNTVRRILLRGYFY